MFGQSQTLSTFLFIVDNEKAGGTAPSEAVKIGTHPSKTDAMAFAAYHNHELNRIPFYHPNTHGTVIDMLRNRASVNPEDRWSVYLAPPQSENRHEPQLHWGITPPGMDHWGGPSMSPQEPAHWGRGPQQQFGPTTFGGPGTYSTPPSRGMSPQQHTSFGWGPNGGPKPGTVGQSKHTCQSCYRPYRAELLVDEEVWEQIKPASGGPLIGLLCPTCVMERIMDLGLGTKGQLIPVPKNTTM